MYESFLSTRSQKQWNRIGLKRRAGVAAPLFSLYSQNSLGIGEIPDLKLLIDWCKTTGMSIIQLLPMNDVGFGFSPYTAQSTFALDPMYLSLDQLMDVNDKILRSEVVSLRKKFPVGARRVNYEIKKAKLNLLWGVFQASHQRNSYSLQRYTQENHFWLKDYALFKVAKERNQERSWEEWEERIKQRDAEALRYLEDENRERMAFHQWLQWQLLEQMKRVKEYAQDRGVLLMGDLPFLVSRDSADVWAGQDYFKLGFSSGAPPDAFFASGQRWGTPPYHWENIQKQGYDYLIEKLRYAQNFYDLFRIDHVIGLFRVWTISLTQPAENAGLNGAFDPPDEALWEEHGRSLLSVMIEHTKMLLCGEDLGVVPACSYKVLEECGIPGMEIQRWTRDWGKSYDFRAPEQYRKNGIATISTHDMSPLSVWWEWEAGTLDEMLVRRKCQERGILFEQIKDHFFDLKRSAHGRLRWRKGLTQEEVSDWVGWYRESYDEKLRFWNYLGVEGEFKEESTFSLVKGCLEKISQTASIFSIQLLHDWLSLDRRWIRSAWDFRINFPGTVSDKNWSLLVPISLEEMLALPINSTIREINVRNTRI